MLYCNNCIINPICQIGCEKLLENKNLITIEDFNKCTKLIKRLMSMSISNKYKRFYLRLECNIKVKIERTQCQFIIDGGRLHREDGPALEYFNGTKYWYKNGKRHREDGPAVEHYNGYKEWYINGRLHREDGPAIEFANGSKEWWINGKYHREEGPAVEHVSGTREWWINGKLQKKE